MSDQSTPSNVMPTWAMLFVVVVAVLIYTPTYNGEFLLDDFDAIVENASVTKGLSGIPEIWTQEYRAAFVDEGGSLYRPLTQSIFAMVWSIDPGNTIWFHLLNLLLYGICVLLLIRWLRLLFPREHWWLWAFIALIFAVHPIHTEVVANIKSADELLSVAFALMCLASLHRAIGDAKLVKLLIPASWFFLALCSKEGVVTLLAFIPILAITRYERKAKFAITTTAIMAMPVVVYLLLRALAIGGLTGSEETPVIDNIIVGAEGIARFTTPITLLGYYVWKLLAPWSLSHDYSFRQLEPMGLDHPGFWAALVCWGAIAYLLVYFRKKHLGIWVSLLMLVITISIYSNLLLVIGTHFAERLMFLPSVAFSMLLGWLFYLWALRNNPNKSWSGAKWSVGAMLILGFLMAGKSMDRGRLWKNGKDLFEADVKTAPMSTRTHYRLGRYYNKLGLGSDMAADKQKWHKDALIELKLSLQIFPKFADAHSELALAYQNLNQFDLALSHNNQALAINPNHTAALNNKGAVLFLKDQPERAISYIERALELQPNFRDAAGNLGSCHGRLGHFEEAAKWFKRAIEIDPSHASNYYFLAMTYNNLGDEELTQKWLQLAKDVEAKQQDR